MTAKRKNRGPGLLLVLEAMARKDPGRRHLLRLLDATSSNTELAALAEQVALADLWRWANAALSASKAGRAKRNPPLERAADVLDAHRRMRRHVSQREDARRIAAQLGMPVETVRGILKRSRKSLT